MTDAPTRRRERFLFAAGVLVLLAGLFASARVAPRKGADFLSFYIMGEAVLTGANIYEAVPRAAISERLGFVPPVGMFYPPATGFVVAPLALLPYDVAKHFWFVLLNAAVIFGVRELVRLAAPRAGPHVWMMAVGTVLLSAGLRWGLMLSQGAPLMLGLLCFFVVVLHRNRPGWALLIAALATAFKMTLAVPFVGLLLLHRRFGAVVVSGGVWVVLNALGFLRMGGSALEIYTQNMASLDALDDFTNVNMPDPWNGVSLPRLDWVYLFYGVTRNLPFSRLLTLVCCAAVSLYLLREGIRRKPPFDLPTSAMFLGPLVCLGSLCVYHHQYDLCLFFVPTLLVLFGHRPVPLPRVAVGLALPLVVMIVLLPIGKTQHLLELAFGPTGFAVLKLSFPVVVTFALVGSLLALRDDHRARSGSGAVGVVSPARNS